MSNKRDLSPESIKKLKEAGRKGGTKKKGSKSAHVLDREQALEAYKQGVIKSSRTLLNVQKMLAFGSIKVFRIDTHWEQNGKSKVKVRSKPQLVINDDEIIEALDYEYGDGESPNDDTTFYFVTTKDPDQRAIDSLLDRTFGKAKESMEIKHSGISLKDMYKTAIDKPNK